MDTKKVVLGVVGVLAAAKVLGWTFSYLRGQLLVFQAKRRRHRIRSKIPSLPVVSTEVKAKVLGCTAAQLVEEMKAGRLTCVEVMATYIERASTLGREMNLTGEEVFDEAMTAAAAADRQRETDPDSLGLLFGLPISVKDHIHQRGCSSSGGVIKNSYKVQEDDSLPVALIRKEGGIPFVRSNLTQVMMWFETDNHLYGRAENPWDRTRTVGGSSGGEGGLISSRCSSLGIGADTGGSIRIPASFCGVYGFKPTPQRVRFEGCVTAHKDDYSSTLHLIPVSYGPLGKSVDDLALLLMAWWQPETYRRDPHLVPLIFNSEMYTQHSGTKPLRIGYFSYDGIFDCCPTQKRLLEEAKMKLQALGHEVVDFQPPGMPEIMQKFVQAAFAGGRQETVDSLQGEPPYWFYSLRLFLESVPLLHKLSMQLLRLIGFGRAATLLNAKLNINSREFFELHECFMNYRLGFAKIWTDLRLDVVLCPSVTLPACPHGMTDLMISQLASLWLFNILRFPSGVVPAGQIPLAEERYDSAVQDGVTKRAKKVMENASGLPVALQVAALPFEDEKALGVMKILEGLFNFHKHPI